MIICIVLQHKCINNTNTVDVLHKCNSSLETEDKNAQDNQTNPKKKKNERQAGEGIKSSQPLALKTVPGTPASFADDPASHR